MQAKHLKYLLAYIIPLVIYVSFLLPNLFSFFSFFFLFGLIPVLELFFPVVSNNHEITEEVELKTNSIFDFLLYLNVPIQGFLMFVFIQKMQQDMSLLQRSGCIISMGIACGILGINVAHELGHRKKWYEKLMSWALLSTSLYMHFYIEHNRGHHTYVATPKDPATARVGENLYAFWIRSTIGSYISAWQIQLFLLNKNNSIFFSYKNLMLWFTVFQCCLVVGIYLCYGYVVCICFVLAAIFGFLLLETVNYIEHYGLLRKLNADGKYERVKPEHSWNSNHIIGRILLYELTRHSDHHYLASRKYQILRNLDSSPQLPFGYPTSMLMSFIPSLWFKTIDSKLKDHLSKT